MAGLQPERTELAWRRTALGIGVGSLIALRVLPAAAPTDAAQLLWLAPGLLGSAFAVVLWALARARSGRANRALMASRFERMPGAGLLATLTIFVAACAVGALVLLVALAGSSG